MAEIMKYTREGFAKLKEEYEFRSKEERERIKVAIAEARSFGDLSENAEYDEARNEQAKNEARIKELEELIEHAEVVDDIVHADQQNYGAGTVSVYADFCARQKIAGRVAADAGIDRIVFCKVLFQRPEVGNGIPEKEQLSGLYAV